MKGYGCDCEIAILASEVAILAIGVAVIRNKKGPPRRTTLLTLPVCSSSEVQT